MTIIASAYFKNIPLKCR